MLSSKNRTTSEQARTCRKQDEQSKKFFEQAIKGSLDKFGLVVPPAKLAKQTSATLLAGLLEQRRPKAV